MDNKLYLIPLVAVIIICILICAFKNICNIHKLSKDKQKPYYHLKLMENIISLEITALVLWAIIFCTYLIFRGGFILNDLLINIAINVGCSVGVTVILSVIVYFKFLKHIPDETKKQIDDLLNARLGYETTNHNAAIQKTDSAQNFLSREHSEIKQGIYSTSKGLLSLSGKIDSEKERKELQYNLLKDNEKTIADSINKLSALGEVLERVNLENHQLLNEVTQLKQKNLQLQEQLSHHQAQNNSFTQSMEM